MATPTSPVGIISYTSSFFWMERSADMVGRGSFGQVHKGRHRETGEFVAVKTCDRRDDAQHEREIDILKKLDSPYIVKLVAVQTIEDLSGRRAIIMELADGNVRDELAKAENYFGLPYETLLKMISHLERGLSYLNVQMIAHRDVKPANILIFNNQNDVTFKLCDFGGSRRVDSSTQPLHSICGTPGYLNKFTAANLARRTQALAYTKDECDLWSVGCTIFECATGRLPFIPAGGLTDSLAMHNLIVSRPADVIYGDAKPDGTFVWGRELPRHRCFYPKSLRLILTEFLRRLFDTHETRLNFQQFSDLCIELVSLRRFKVFNVNKLLFEDYFDRSSANRFERANFEDDIQEELPRHDAVCVFTLPSGLALSSLSFINKTIMDGASNMVVMALEKQNDYFTIPLLTPEPAVSSVPYIDELLSSNHERKFTIANILRLERQFDAVSSFAKGVIAFCHSFWDIIDKAVDTSHTKIDAAQRIIDAVRLQSAALSLGRPFQEKTAIEGNAGLVTREIQINKRNMNGLRSRMQQIKEDIDRADAIQISKCRSIKEKLDIVVKNRTIESASGLPRNNVLAEADSRFLFNSLKNAISVFENRSSQIGGIINGQIGVILGNLYGTSTALDKAKKQMEESMQLVDVTQQTNQHRIQINEQDAPKSDTSRASDTNFSSALKKAMMEARQQRAKAEESLRRTHIVLTQGSISPI